MMKNVSRIFLMGTITALLLPGWDFVLGKFMVEQNPLAGTVYLLLLLAVIVAFGLLGFKRIRPRSNFLIADWFWVVCVSCLWDAVYEAISFGKHPLIIQVHDTSFVIAGGHVFAAFAGLFGFAGFIYYFFQKITGRMILAAFGWIHFATGVAGILLIVHFGLDEYLWRARRYMDIEGLMSYDRQNMYLIWTVLAVAAAQALFIFNLVYSAVWGKKSSN